MGDFVVEIERRIATLKEKIERSYFPMENEWEEGQVEAYEESLQIYWRRRI